MRTFGVGPGAAAAALAAALGVVAAPAFTPDGASAGQAPPAPLQPPAAQQPTASPDQQPVFRTGINFVRVDVIVTDRQGNPVPDLRQADFEVFEEGEAQTVETFRLVRIDMTRPAYTSGAIRTRDDEETAARDETARIFVFFLDDYHVRRDASMRLRAPLVDFIATQLSPNDLVAVMSPLTPLDAVVLSRDHQGVIRAIERFWGRKFDYEPINDIERGYVYRYPTEVVERIRRDVSLSALKGLAFKLGSLREGRKSIVLVSEGYLAMLPPQMRDAIAGMPGSGANPGRYDPFAGDNNQNEERARLGAEADLNTDLQSVYDAANRNNTSIYALDPRGLTGGDFDITANISMTTSQRFLNHTMDTLRVLADNTDGRAIVNQNDLATGLKQLVRDSSAYYLLGYNSTRAPTDGKFHEIRVRVRRQGVQVRARRGYWAFTEADVARATATTATNGPSPAVTKALSAIAPASNHRVVRTWIGTGRGTNGLARVTVLWEPLQAAPGTRRDEARRVALLATTAAGEVVYRGRMPADAPSASFNAPPGRLDLRFTIEGDAGTIDNEDRTLDVPDLTAPDVRLATPKVWVARTAREFQTLTAEPAAPPTANREFRRTDRMLVRADALGPAAAPVTVSARLLSQQGAKMLDVPVTPPAADGEGYVVDLPLSSFAPGQYLLEFSAAADGHEPVTELVAFRITG
jgi:VWFA-related protein